MANLHTEARAVRVYLTTNSSQGDVADDFGVSARTISNWVDKHGLESKSVEASLHTQARAIRMYFNTDKSQARIGDEFNVVSSTISKWISAHGLETEGHRQGDSRLHDAVWLRRKYIDDRMGSYMLAQELDCSANAVLKALNRAGIETRPSFSEEADSRLRDPDWLRQRYADDGAGIEELVEELSASDTSVLAALDRAGIETRPRGPHAVYCEALDCDVASRAELQFVRGLINADLLDNARYQPGSISTEAGRWEPDFAIGGWLVECKHGDITGRMGGEPYRQAAKIEHVDAPVLLYGLTSDARGLPYDIFVEYRPGETPDLEWLR